MLDCWQELKALRETREGLDDQIERLQWALTHGPGPPCAPPTSSSDEEDDEEAMREVCTVPSLSPFHIAIHRLL